MDKETLSHYGWIIICVLVLATLLAFASPFSSFLARGFEATATGFFHTGDGKLSDTLDTLGVVPSIDELQSKHKFEYYSTLHMAISDVNDATIGKNADVDKEDAVAGIYVDRGKISVVLLKDTTEAVKIPVTTNMTLNLGGNTLSFQGGKQLGVPSSAPSPNFIIDGRLKGSTIQNVGKTAGQNTNLINISSGTCEIKGGTYISESVARDTSVVTATIINKTSNLTITDATITSKNTDGGLISSVYTLNNGTLSLNNCEVVTVSSESAYGVACYGAIVETSNSKISVSGNDLSIGIAVEEGQLKTSNCSVSSNSNVNSTGVLSNTATINLNKTHVQSNGDEISKGIDTHSTSNATLFDSSVSATSQQICFGIENYINSTLSLSHSSVTATAQIKSKGIHSYATPSTTLSNSTIKAYSNYTEDDNNGYANSSLGVMNSGALVIKDCNIFGAHSAVQTSGPTTVNGGTYEGIGHGGFYFSGSDVEHHVMNAKIRECKMPQGYINTAQQNGAGFYIGGGNDCNSIKVYIDNCNIFGSRQPIVLRSTDGEQNNTLYISNSKINTDKNIRIDGTTHTLFIGKGNNFTAANTTKATRVVNTNEIYK